MVIVRSHCHNQGRVGPDLNKIVYLSILPLVDLWVVFCFFLLQIILLWTFSKTSVGAHVRGLSRKYKKWLELLDKRYVCLKSYKVVPSYSAFKFSYFVRLLSRVVISLDFHPGHSCERAPFPSCSVMQCFITLFSLPV